MGSEGQGNSVHLLYRLRSAGLVAVVSAVDDRGAEELVYEGYLLGLGDAFNQARLRMAVPRSIVDKANPIMDGGQPEQVMIDDGELVDELQLTYIALPPDSAGLGSMTGSVINGDEIVDVAAIDDPVTLTIFTVFGAVTLICLAKLGVSAWLLDRAHARQTAAGEKVDLLIETSADAEVAVEPGKFGRLKAKLRCKVRGQIIGRDGAVMESTRAGET